MLLLTGASVAGVVKATTDSVSTTTRDMRAAVQRRRPTEELEALETEEPRVSRATPPAEEWEEPKPFWSGEERFPDIYERADRGGAEPEPEPEPEPEEPAEPRLAEDPGDRRAGRDAGVGDPTSRRRAATARTSPSRPTSSGRSRTRSR